MLFLKKRKNGKFESFSQRGKFSEAAAVKKKVQGVLFDNWTSFLMRMRMMQTNHHHIHHDNDCAYLAPASLVDVNWAAVFSFFGLNN